MSETSATPEVSVHLDLSAAKAHHEGRPTTIRPTQFTAETPAAFEPRRTNGLVVSDVLSFGGAVLASLGLTTVVFTQLAPLTGPLPFAVVAYMFFLVIYAILVAADERVPVVWDRVVLVAVHTLAFTVFAVLVFVVAFSLIRGADALPHLNFYSQDMSLAGPLDPLDVGGIVHAIVGTLIQISIALLITIPLGLITALFLTEMPGAFSRFVRTIVEAMTALPSIVAGLFIYASAILLLGLPKSGFAASLAITVMMLPIMIRSSDVVLRLVPQTLKEASIGLGASQWATVWRVTLPTSRSGLMTGIILATARGVGETSPVLLTSGFTAAFNANPFDGPMVSLPLAVFQFVKSPEPNMIARGFGTAAVLMLLVLLLFLIARFIGGLTVEQQLAFSGAFVRAAGWLAKAAKVVASALRIAAKAVAAAAITLTRWITVTSHRISLLIRRSQPGAGEPGAGENVPEELTTSHKGENK